MSSFPPLSEVDLEALEKAARRLRAQEIRRLVIGLRDAVVVRLRRRSLRDATYRELDGLDDRMLADIGLHRGEIPYVAAAAAIEQRAPANRNHPPVAA